MSNNKELLLKIGQVAKQLKISSKRIREYEKEGLIKPLRDKSNGYRLFDNFDIQRLVQLQQLIHKRGFTLSSLRYLVLLAPCWEIFPCNQINICPAYKNPHSRCWELKLEEHSGCNCMGDCERCPIYTLRAIKTYPIFSQIPR